MKYAIILLVMCLPLGSLTALSVVQLFVATTTSLDHKADPYQEARPFAEDAERVAKAIEQPVAQWADLELFDPRPAQLVNGETAEAQLVVEAGQALSGKSAETR